MHNILMCATVTLVICNSIFQMGRKLRLTTVKKGERLRQQAHKRPVGRPPKTNKSTQVKCDVYTCRYYTVVWAWPDHCISRWSGNAIPNVFCIDITALEQPLSACMINTTPRPELYKGPHGHHNIIVIYTACYTLYMYMYM